MEKSHVGMAQCFYCGEDSTILLDRRLKNTLPMRVGVVNLEPCSKCMDYMAQGIILISISNDTTEEEMKKEFPNPYRTGGWCVAKQEAIERVFEKTGKLENMLKQRFAFVTDEVWDFLGLPREETKNDQAHKSTRS